MTRFRIIVMASFLGMTGLVVSGCQTVAGMELAAASAVVSPAQEAELGAQYAIEVEKEVALMNDPAADAWVKRLGAELVANSEPCEQTFVFHVTTDPTLNAFAIPGGHCYVNAGLIAAAENEAEVAAVMGHEVNHVVRRHGMRGLVRQYGLQMITDGLSGGGGAGGQVAALVAQTGGVLTVRRFGREDEREADQYGVEAMYKAGYDPQAAVTFFQKLMAASGGGGGSLAALVSTHPPTQERIDNISAQIATYPRTGKERKDSGEFQAVKAKVVQYLKDHPPAQPAS